MRWTKTNFRNGMHLLLGKNGPSAAEAWDDPIETIRSAMLLSLGPPTAAGDPHSAHVMSRIRFSKDAEDLWYLRGDVLALLSASQGEAAAYDCMDALAPLFEGLLPRGLANRPARLRN